MNSNYIASNLFPKILIHNLDGTLKYTYETSQIATSPTQDFSLNGIHIHLGINDDYGNATLEIQDNSNLLIETNNKKSKIKNQWSIQIYLGKTSATLERWFYGKIFESEIIKPTPNQTIIRLTCVGWGIRLKERMTKIKRFQDKTSDGLALDSTDTSAKVSEIAKDIVSDTDHFLYSALPSETEITTSVDDIDIKLADFQLNATSWSDGISQLAGMSNSSYHVDADRKLVFTNSDTDSGFLFDSSVVSYDSLNWNGTKLGYIKRAPFTWKDSSVDTGYSFIHAYGVQNISKDTEQTTANANYSLHNNWIAIPFTPTSNNVSKISLSMAKTGTPADIATFEIFGGASSPDYSDLRKEAKLSASSLTTLDTSYDWREIALDNVTVTPREQLYLIIKQYGTSSNTINAEYQTGSGTYYTSSDGVTWSSVTGDFKIRVYNANNLITTLENTVAKRKFGVREKILTFNNIQEETVRDSLVYTSDILSKEKRSYSSMIVTAPTSRVLLGKTCKVIDTSTGLDIVAEINSVDINVPSEGASEISVGLVEFR
jgi:hypothetical protein